jgi:hypothetical protein
MATGSQALTSLRGSIEATEGAATTPTRLLYLPQGALTFTRAKEPIAIELAWNKADRVQDILSGIEDVTVNVATSPVSTEDFGWWLSAFDAALGQAPSLSDTTAYTRTGAPSQTDNTVSATGTRSLYLQFGATDLLTTYGVGIPGLIGESLTFNFSKRASGTDTGCTWSGTFRTASAITPITAFTGSLSDRSQTWMIGNYGKTFVDTTTMGSTADANITSGTFTLSRPATFHDGMDQTGLHTSMHRAMGWDTDLTLVRKFSDLTEYNAYVGTASIKTLRKVRVIFEGALAGAATAKHTVRLEFVGKHVSISEPEWNDGLYYATHTLRGMFDSTNTASWDFLTINAVSAAYTAA